MSDFLIPVTGLLALIVAWRDCNEIVKLRPDRILFCWAVGCGTMVLGAAVLSCFMPLAKPDYDFTNVAVWRLFAAGLEDAVFVLPAFFIRRPFARIFFLAYSSVVFASGHMYQGDLGALVKLPVVFVTYLLARRFGILTTIVAHSVNDVAAYYVVVLLEGVLKR